MQRFDGEQRGRGLRTMARRVERLKGTGMPR